MKTMRKNVSISQEIYIDIIRFRDMIKREIIERGRLLYNY